MSLLIEEIVNRIKELTSGIAATPIRWFFHFLYLIISIIIFCLVVYLVLTGKELIVIIFFSIYLLGELAHYIRKKREQQIKEIPLNNDLLSDLNKNK
jgi:Flp pilus assembly protein TadB